MCCIDVASSLGWQHSVWSCCIDNLCFRLDAYLMTTLDLYKTNDIMTASGSTLVVRLYEGSIRFLKLAIRDIENADYESKANNINKAIDVLFELNASLDMDVAPDIAMNLRSLYLFCIKHIKEANVELDTTKLNEAINILSELLSGWKAITS